MDNNPHYKGVYMAPKCPNCHHEMSTVVDDVETGQWNCPNCGYVRDPSPVTEHGVYGGKIEPMDSSESDIEIEKPWNEHDDDFFDVVSKYFEPLQTLAEEKAQELFDKCLSEKRRCSFEIFAYGLVKKRQTLEQIIMSLLIEQDSVLDEDAMDYLVFYYEYQCLKAWEIITGSFATQ